MKRIKLTKEQLQRARKIATYKPKRDSIKDGNGVYEGSVGEVVVADHFREIGKTVVHKNTHNYDMLVSDYTCEVKTKPTTVEPLPEYSCTVKDTSLFQKCDFYAFVRFKHPDTAWYCGTITKKDFMEKSHTAKKGDTDFTDPDFTYKADNHYVFISDLNNTDR